MGMSKTEVNFHRLLAAAPQQQNQAKLAHYVATLREQLEQLAEERTADGLPRIPKVLINEYSEKIEAIAAKLVTPLQDDKADQETLHTDFSQGSPNAEKYQPLQSAGLRRRVIPASATEDRIQTYPKKEDRIGGTTDSSVSGSVKLDAVAHAHIEKHRKLQEDLTDEMVGLARQLKETSLMMSQSVQNTEKILDSTESAVEHSLASTNRANVRASEIFSKTSKTTCFTWILIFLMTCIFIMVVLLIRVT